MQDTLTPGRLDIVIFPNGGREFIGRLPADPEIPEDIYLPEVAKFVAEHQNLPQPEKFTGYYSIKNDRIQISWGEYAGEIQRAEPDNLSPYERMQMAMKEMDIPDNNPQQENDIIDV